MKHEHLTDELQVKASLYAAGAMPADEKSEYVRHLEEDDCDICRREAYELQAAMTSLTFGLPTQTPSPSARLRLMQQALRSAETHRPEPTQHRRRVAWATGLAALTASVLLAVVWNDNMALRRLNDVLSREIARLQAQLDDRETRMATLTAPQVRVVDLAGQGATVGARGRIFWNPSARRWYFYVHDLPPAATDRSYQLWFVPATGNPVSAGVFNTSPDGTAIIDVSVPDNLPQLKAAAVTTEPAGGLPQPTGPFALLGTLE
jgi:anti-sigma-K factor RskA